MFALTWLLVGLSAFAASNQKPLSTVIYGEDTRVDLYDVHDPKILALADSTVAMVSQNDISSNDDGSVALKLESYSEANRLCPTERFADQMMLADCSGFLISPTRIATAGHCMRNNDDCAHYAFIFNFALKNKGEVTPSTLPESQVYSCKKIVVTKERGGADFAIIELDRPVPGEDHVPLKINKTGKIALNTKLFVIGYPSGLPTKYADKAKVRSADDTSFVSNLDTYASNSGSAVFNAETLVIEGILGAGETDFVEAPEKSCQISNVCDNDGCRGETATKAAVLSKYLKL